MGSLVMPLVKLSTTSLVTNDKNPTHMNLRLERIEEPRGVAEFKPISKGWNNITKTLMSLYLSVLFCFVLALDLAPFPDEIVADGSKLTSLIKAKGSIF